MTKNQALALKPGDMLKIHCGVGGVEGQTATFDELDKTGYRILIKCLLMSDGQTHECYHDCFERVND